MRKLEVRSQKSKVLKSILFLLLFIPFLAGCDETEKPVAEVSFSVPTLTYRQSDESYLNRTSFPRLTFSFSQSVAKIDLVNQDVTSKIKMLPLVPGTWKFTSDSTLVFTPSANYKEDTSYRIELHPDLFTKNVLIKKMSYDFQTPPLEASLDDLSLYTDPTDPKIKQVTASLYFNYPVDLDSVRKAVTLKHDKKNIPVTLAKDPKRPVVYVTSDPISIEKKEYYVTLSLPDAVSLKDKAHLSDPVSDSLRIPSMGEYFKLSYLSSSVIRNTEKNNRPEQILFISFTSPVTPEALEKVLDVRVVPYRSSSSDIKPEEIEKAPILEMTMLPIEKDFSKDFTFKYDYTDTSSNTQLLVQIKEGLESADGFVTGAAVTQRVSIPRYPREVDIGLEGAVLSSAGARVLPIRTLGVPGVRVKLARVKIDDLNHLISQTYGDLTQMRFNSYNFNEDNVSDRFEKVLPLHMGHPADVNYASMDLTDYLKAGQGFFYVTAEGYDPAKKSTLTSQSKRFIMVTDLGLLVKDNADGSHDVFVSSFKEGDPVYGATVSVLAKNGRTLMSKTTDVHGRVSFPKLSDFRNEKQPVAYVASYRQDYAFIPVSRGDRQLNYSKFDTGGSYSSPAPETIQAFLFTDRGLYRPGDSVNFGYILKRKDFAALGSLPLEVRIDDPRGSTVLRQKMTLPQSGFMEMTYPTKPFFQTGEYSARLYLIRENRSDVFLGSVPFTLREFEPDTLKIRLATDPLPPDGWIADKEVKVKVNLQNLFGFPAADRKIVGRYTLTPASFSLSQYAGYVFTDPLRASARYESKSFPLDDIKTDDKGEAVFPIDLSRYAGGTYLLEVSAEGFDIAGGRGVVGKTSALLSPLTSVVGYKVDGSLYAMRQKTKRTVNFIAVNPDAASIAAEDLSLTLVRKQFVSTLVRQPNSTYKYQSVLKESVVSEKPFEINPAGTSVTLDTEKPGDYALRLTDKDKTLVAEVAYSVLGQSNETFALDKNAELSLKLSKTEYNPGETMMLSLTAPYTGYGLITIETDKVHAVKWFRAETTSSVQTIRLPEGIEGNAYVNVAFMRDFKSKEVFASPLSYAVKPFNINLSARTVKIDLNTPALVKSGDVLTVKYKTSQPSRIVIYGVDEGILQVAKYTLPNPLRFFFTKKALQVTTFQTVDLLLPEFSLLKMMAGIGGDESEILYSKESQAPRQLNPFARKTVKPVVFWSGLLDADTTEKTFTWATPDTFNGQLRVMAVAASSSAIGSTEKKLNVRAPIVLSPSVPVFAAPSDTFKTTLGVFNTVKGAKDAEVLVTVTPTEHFDIPNASMTLTLSEGQEKPAAFDVTVKDKLGQGFITYTAEIKGKPETRSSQRVEISVRPAAPLSTSLTYGMLKKSYTTPDLTSFYNEHRVQEIYASPSPLVLMKGMLRYLDSYPHGCTEQIISRVYPKMFLVDAGFVKAADVKREVEAVLAEMRMRQTYQGGFSLWPSGRSDSVFATLYAISFMTDAQRKGYTVPRDMFNNAKTWLQGFAGRKPGNDDEFRQRAEAVYLLALNGVVVTPTLLQLQTYGETQLKEKFYSDISAVHLGAAAALLKDEPRAKKLASGYKINKKNDFMDDVAAALVYATALPDLKSSVKENFFERAFDYIAGTRLNTRSSAYILRALEEYADSAGAQPITFTADIGDKKEALEPSKVSAFHFVTLTPEMKRVKLASDKPFFYSLTQEGFVRDLPLAQKFEGLEVHRVFLNADGKEVTSAKIGETLTVKVTVRSEKERLSDTVLVDLFPTGFELVSKEPSPTSSLDYFDMREDRALLYFPIDSSLRTYTYQMKPVVAGDFILPPLFAEGIYRLDIRGFSKAGRFTVKE